MSATRTLRKALVRDGSLGGSRVTSGLSSVGPPPTLRINQLLWNFNMRGSRSLTTSAPNTSRYHSREVSWSRTTRKWVTITPSRGAGMSSRFILLGSFLCGLCWSHLGSLRLLRAWCEADHDDLVLAALCAWAGPSRQTPPPWAGRRRPIPVRHLPAAPEGIINLPCVPGHFYPLPTLREKSL